MFDTHCHLNSSEFDVDLKNVIERAREAKVRRFLVPGLDWETSKKAVGIAEDFENVYAAIGIHPTENLEEIDLTDTIYKLTELANSNFKIIAIGETGLDYFRYQSGESIQKLFFVSQIKLAVKLDKTLIIHNRHATDDVIKSIESVGVSLISGKAIFHCCSPESELLDFAIKNRIYIGVDGDVTYDEIKKDFVKGIPLDLLLLETDSPNLTPNPTRTSKKFPNEPKNLEHIAQFIAEIKNISNEELVKITTDNANRLFGLNE